MYLVFLLGCSYCYFNLEVTNLNVWRRYRFYLFNTSNVLLVTTKVLILIDGIWFEEVVVERVILNCFVLFCDYFRNFLIFRFLDFPFDETLNGYKKWRIVSSYFVAISTCCFSVVIAGLNLYATFGIVPDDNQIIELIEYSLIILTYLPIASACWKRITKTPGVNDYFYLLEETQQEIENV